MRQAEPWCWAPAPARKALGSASAQPPALAPAAPPCSFSPLVLVKGPVFPGGMSQHSKEFNLSELGYLDSKPRLLMPSL